MYIYNDTYDVLNDSRNTAYWIVINKILNETAKGNFKNTFVHLQSSPVARRRATGEERKLI